MKDSPTPTQVRRLETILAKFQQWKKPPFAVVADWFQEPWSNGSRTVHVEWKYKDGCIWLDGSALISVGVRGAMQVFHANDGVRVGDLKESDQDIIRRVAVMTGIPAKPAKRVR